MNAPRLDDRVHPLPIEAGVGLTESRFLLTLDLLGGVSFLDSSHLPMPVPKETPAQGSRQAGGGPQRQTHPMGVHPLVTFGPGPLQCSQGPRPLGHGTGEHREGAEVTVRGGSGSGSDYGPDVMSPFLGPQWTTSLLRFCSPDGHPGYYVPRPHAHDPRGFRPAVMTISTQPTWYGASCFPSCVLPQGPPLPPPLLKAPKCPSG